MVSSRVATAAAGVLASLLVSVVVWKVFGVGLFFLAVPFVPLLFRERSSDSEPTVHECPECGFRTRTPDFEYCPRDGTRLRRR
ncbi:hypothetical protein [Halobacterium bonnevillei]|uniref:Uncharacterized protein n=1 Tax=Halobacterium bonnevillei TaxID=2692200 RepID=A0A6B0SEL5_9EURY|nr:hypothetical protein [Halobacterium bonnevillei]MXR19427.1 hypothetical protein [Halobacterium bonnevillei]